MVSSTVSPASIGTGSGWPTVGGFVTVAVNHSNSSGPTCLGTFYACGGNHVRMKAAATLGCSWFEWDQELRFVEDVARSGFAPGTNEVGLSEWLFVDPWGCM